MNRVIEVNEANAFALVEPGVSYFDLYRHIQEHKLKVWIDCPDPGWGSVIGNALDRGGGYTTANYRNHFDSHCGMEIVLPNGELLRTGMGAIPNAKTWQQYKSGCGPWIDGIFSQSNFGIVTKMGFWLMPEPEAYLRGTVSLSRYSDLEPLVETLNYLENARITTGFPDIASPLNGYPPIGQVQLWNESGPPSMTDEHRKLLSTAKLGYSPELEAYGMKSGIPYWQLWLSFHGPAEVIEAQWQASQRHFAKFEGATFRVVDRVTLPIDPAKADAYHEPELGVPSYGHSRSARALLGIRRPRRAICGSRPSFRAPARPSSKRTGCSAKPRANWTCRCSGRFACPHVSGSGPSFSYWPRP